MHFCCAAYWWISEKYAVWTHSLAKLETVKDRKKSISSQLMWACPVSQVFTQLIFVLFICKTKSRLRRRHCGLARHFKTDPTKTVALCFEYGKTLFWRADGRADEQDISAMSPTLQNNDVWRQKVLSADICKSPTLSFVRFQSTICGPCNVLKAQFLVVWNRVEEIVLKITFYCKLSSIKVISQP
jgi:hypothetical protein